MILKKTIFILALIITLSSLAIARTIETGSLNVFTDLPEAIIYVDGLEAGQESITKLSLEVGEHYVQVKLDGQLIYAEKTIISLNRSSTVVSEHFVDIITKTPSRGAIDREASRLRESRGNIGLGILYQPTLHPAASVKWWVFKHVGIQGIAMGAIPDSSYEGIYGGRVFLSPADKIYNDDVLTGYVFTGMGKVYQDEQAKLSAKTYYEAGITIEANLSNLANKLFELRYATGYSYSHKKTKIKHKGHTKIIEETGSDDINGLLRDLIILGAANLGQLSFEINMVKKENQQINTVIGLGVHVYF